jgi:hypothetical protein
MQSIDSDKKCKFSDSSNMVNGVILLVCQMIGLKNESQQHPSCRKEGTQQHL